MERDPIVEETRNIRRDIEKSLSNDPGKYVEYLHEIEKQHATRLVRRKPVGVLRLEKVAEKSAQYGNTEDDVNRE